jgi:hypothetical protein
MNDQKTADVMVQRAIVEMRSEWSTLVALALALKDEQVKEFAAGLASAVKVGADSVERKIKAIRHQASLGYSAENIIERGQKEVLGEFIVDRKKENYQNQVIMKWQVMGSQRELFQEQEQRIRALLGLNTSIEFWDFMIATLRNVSDEEILESARKE